MGISLYVEGSSKQHGDRKLANMVTNQCLDSTRGVDWVDQWTADSAVEAETARGCHCESMANGLWKSSPSGWTFWRRLRCQSLTFETLKTAPNLRCAHHGQGCHPDMPDFSRGRVASCDHNRAWFSLGDAQTYSARWAVVGQILLHKSRGLNCRCDSKFQSCPQLAQFLRLPPPKLLTESERKWNCCEVTWPRYLLQCRKANDKSIFEPSELSPIN